MADKGLRLIRSGWDVALRDGLKASPTSVRVVSPFIKRRAAERLLERGRPKELRVITRFELGGFAEGVSDLSALRLLLQNGARIRGIQRLHSKLYLFGSARAIVTSANLTESALLANFEFGLLAEEPGMIEECSAYFEFLWERGGADLSGGRLNEWERRVEAHLARHPRRTTVRELPDEGAPAADGGGSPPLPPPVDEARQAFVKFFGVSYDRAHRSEAVIDKLRESGCHWACTYPRGKRPRIVQHGATMLMGWLVEDPDDILVFGRATAKPYRDGEDDASAAEIEARPWRTNWPHYIRVHHAEFLDGALGDGVSLRDLMDALGSDSFASTQRNARRGEGNTNPRRSYGKHAAVRLSGEGVAWLNDRLQAAFAEQGQIGPDALNSLDWPATP